MSFFNLLAKPFYFGWQSHLPNAYNRLTTLVNFYSMAGIVIVLIVSINVYSLGSNLALWYGLPISFAILTLWLNFKGHRTWARLMMIVNINMIALFAGLFFGKGFNGYLAFFLAIFFSVSLFGKEKRHFMIPSIIVSFLGLPLIDILSVYSVVPLLSLPSEFQQHKLPTLLLDTVFITLLFAVGLAMDRWQSETYEKSLELWNVELDKKVQSQTAELSNAKDVAEQGSFLKSQFLNNVSYELKSPLQSIIGTVQLIQTKMNSDIQPLKKEVIEQYLSAIERSSLRLKNLLSPIFEISESANAELDFYPSQSDLNQLISKILSDYERQKFKKKLTVHIYPDHPMTITTDTKCLQVVLKELVDNAFQFAKPNSEIKILCENRDKKCSIEIINQGPGISTNEVSSIFQAFSQGQAALGRAGGAGLGLYRAQRYAQAMKGQITLTNKSPQRTTFRLQFPN